MRALVEFGLANAAMAAGLAVLVFAVGCCIRRPALRNALWILVLCRLVFPPLWSIPIPWHPTASNNTPPAVAITPEALDTYVAWQFPEPPAAYLPSPHDEEPPVAAASPAPLTGIAAAPEPVDPFALIAAVWLAGTMVVLIRTTLRVRRFHRALADAVPAPTDMQRQADGIARTLGLRRAPAILLVPGRISPVLWLPGLFARQARLLLPIGLLPLLDHRQLTAVLAHELAHLRRGDPWVRWLEALVCALYWWHPMLSWMRRQLRQAEEECCDLWVVAATATRRSYATALVETAMYLHGPDSASVPALASGAGPVRNLQRRVTMIMQVEWPARLTRFGLATVLGIGTLGFAFGPALAQDRKEPPARDGERKERVKDRDDSQPRDRERAGERDIDEARRALEAARADAEKAMQRVREAAERLARLEGRPSERLGGRDAVRPPVERGPGDRPFERPRFPDAPVPPGIPRRPGAEGGPYGPGGGELRDLQQQIQELRRALEEMRREMRREGGGERREGGGERREGGDRIPSKTDRGGPPPVKRPDGAR